MLKLLFKIQKYLFSDSSKQHKQSVFVSVNPPSSSSVFINVLEFFPAYFLGGAFFNQGYFKVCEVKDFSMLWPGVHGESRFFPFGGISEAPSVCVGPLVWFLDCSSKVTVLCFTDVALPKVNHVSRLTIQSSWSINFHVVDSCWCVDVEVLMLTVTSGHWLAYRQTNRWNLTE